MWLAKFVERASDVFHHYVLLSITYKRAGSRRCKRSGSVNFRKGETNVNSLKGKVAVSTDPMYVILGASGNTGSIIADSLLSKGKKVRVAGSSQSQGGERGWLLFLLNRQRRRQVFFRLS